MNKPFKPEGYNSASPYFIVDGARQYIDFLQKLFDAKECRLFETPDGKILHAEVKIDDSVIMLGDASDKYPANKLIMHLYVPDCEKVYYKALELGCHSVEEPSTREGDPDKRGTFMDFAGNIWSVGTQL